MKKIVAIIPTFNRKNHLENILKDIYNQDLSTCQLDIITVVDGSTDGTLEMLKENYPNVKIIQGNGNWWYTKSMNEGFKLGLKLKPDFFLTLNDDISINPNYIKILLNDYSTLESSSIIGSVSFTNSQPYRITFPGAGKINWRIKEIPYIKKFSLVNPDSLSGIFPSPILSGRGILIPAKLLSELNFYDEKLPQYGSETDFCLRAVNKGIKIYVTYNAKVFEDTRLTSEGASYNKPKFDVFIKSWFNIHSINSIRNSMYIYRKHCNKLVTPIFFTIVLLGLLKLYFIKYRSLR